MGLKSKWIEKMPVGFKGQLLERGEDRHGAQQTMIPVQLKAIPEKRAKPFQQSSVVEVDPKETIQYPNAPKAIQAALTPSPAQVSLAQLGCSLACS
jgi:hypothetical protein